MHMQVLGLLLARRLNVIRRPFEILGQYVLTQQVRSASPANLLFKSNQSIPFYQAMPCHGTRP